MPAQLETHGLQSGPYGLSRSCILGSRAPRQLQHKPVVTKRIPQPRYELSPSVREHEAKLLATMLRTSRLTWVFGEPGTDSGALLKYGVMPLLQRRCGDRRVASSAGVVAPKERRHPPGAARVELAIHFDAWGQAPLSQLKNRIRDIAPPAAMVDVTDGLGLAQTVRKLNQVSGLHFVFLLDRFEEYLAHSPDEAEFGQFADQLVEAILQQNLPVSFLVAMDEVARPRLERFRAHIPGFDHNVLRLSPVSDLRDRPLQTPVLTEHSSTQSGDAKGRRGPPPRVPVKVEDVYELIESTLTRTKAGQP